MQNENQWKMQFLRQSTVNGAALLYSWFAVMLAGNTLLLLVLAYIYDMPLLLLLLYRFTMHWIAFKDANASQPPHRSWNVRIYRWGSVLGGSLQPGAAMPVTVFASTYSAVFTAFHSACYPSASYLLWLNGSTIALPGVWVLRIRSVDFGMQFPTWQIANVN